MIYVFRKGYDLLKNRSNHVSPLKENPTTTQSKAKVLTMPYVPDLLTLLTLPKRPSLLAASLNSPGTFLPQGIHFPLSGALFSRISACLTPSPPLTLHSNVITLFWIENTLTPRPPLLPSMLRVSPSQLPNANMLHNFISFLLSLERKLVGTGILLHLLSEWMMPTA